MNRVFCQLVRNEMIQQLNSLQILQDKKWKTTLMSLLYGAVVLAGALYSAGITYGFCVLGNSESVMPILATVISLLVLLTTIMKAGHQLYESKDLDMLMSYPISLRMILISKCSSSFVVNLLVALTVLVPSSIVLGVLNGKWTLILMSALCAPFLVVFFMSAGMLLASFVTMISSKVKYAKTMTAILLCGLMMCVFGLVGGLSGTSFVIELSERMGSAVSLSPLSALIVDAVYGRTESFVLLVLMALFFCVIVLEIIVRNYLRVRSLVHSSIQRTYTFTAQQSASVMKALIVREFRHYFSSSLYVANTIVGLILGIVLVISVWFVPLDEIIGSMELPIDSEQLSMIFPVVFAMVCSMCCTTASSLSLEGKSVWLLQSLPVSDAQIKAAKVLMNVLLCLPVLLIGSVLLAGRLQLSGGELLVSLFLPLSISIFSAMTGMLANACFQNYSWTSEVQVIKQGLPVLVGMFVPMITCSLLMSIMLLYSQRWIEIAACLGMLICSAVEWRLIQRKPIED